MKNITLCAARINGVISGVNENITLCAARINGVISGVYEE